MQNYNSKFKSNLHDRCFKVSLDIIELTNNLPNKRSAWVISDQLIRSACSVGANLTEGKASSSRLEFKRFYEISLKSANESLYWLKLLKESGLNSSEKKDQIYDEITEISKMLASGVLKLKGKKL